MGTAHVPATGHRLNEAIWNDPKQTKIRNKFLLRDEIQQKHDSFLQRAELLREEELKKSRRMVMSHRLGTLEQTSAKTEQREKVQNEMGQRLPQPPSVPPINPFLRRRSTIELLTGPKVLPKFGEYRLTSLGQEVEAQQTVAKIREEHNKMSQIQIESEYPAQIRLEDSKRLARRMSNMALVSPSKIIEKDANMRAIGSMVKNQEYFFKNSSGELLTRPIWDDMYHIPERRQKLFRDIAKEKAAVKMIKKKMMEEDDNETYREMLRDAHRDYVLRGLHQRKLKRIELERRIGTKYVRQCPLKSLPAEMRLIGSLEMKLGLSPRGLEETQQDPMLNKHLKPIVSPVPESTAHFTLKHEHAIKNRLNRHKNVTLDFYRIPDAKSYVDEENDELGIMRRFEPDIKPPTPVIDEERVVTPVCASGQDVIDAFVGINRFEQIHKNLALVT